MAWLAMNIVQGHRLTVIALGHCLFCMDELCTGEILQALCPCSASPQLW